MESSKVFLLLIGICCLVLVGQAYPECCTSYTKLKFRMNRGTCDMVGGYGGSECEVTICADGVARKGAHCGQGPCNVRGCNCDGGCITGEWGASFREKNNHYGLELIEELFVPFSVIWKYTQNAV